jgi:hypothetical protein
MRPPTAPFPAPPRAAASARGHSRRGGRASAATNLSSVVCFFTAAAARGRGEVIIAGPAPANVARGATTAIPPAHLPARPSSGSSSRPYRTAGRHRGNGGSPSRRACAEWAQNAQGPKMTKARVLIPYREYVFGPQTSDGPVRIEFSVEPCSKICGRASEVWSRARSARLTLVIRALRVAFGRSARSK